MSQTIAVTMGEPSGISGELTLKMWLAFRSSSTATFFSIDDPSRLAQLAKMLALPVPIRIITEPAEAADCFQSALPVLPIKVPVQATPGKLSPTNNHAVLQSIDLAVEFALTRQVAAVVTNPIHKDTLYQSGFAYPGHTEYIASKCGALEPIMLFSSPSLRTIPVTIHCSMRDAIEQLTSDLIVRTVMITDQSLRHDFAISSPRIAVAGLNPHAGENGAMGQEDIAIIQPAVAHLRQKGYQIAGPLAPDSMFSADTRRSYDAAVCMYHDQALIPIKTLHFEDGVNFTAGLPIIRTSPDHGTALDIAGRSIANPRSLIAALTLATAIAKNRSAEGADRKT